MSKIPTTTYNDKKYNDYMMQHNTKSPELSDKSHTHTRMPNTDLNIYGGSFVISKTELKDFLTIYAQHVFVNKRKEHLTEKQLDKNGPLLIDIDFRYNKEIDSRQHTKEDKKNIILLYLDEIKELYHFTDGKPFNVYLMEKPNVNNYTDNNVTKDGIHIIIGIQMDHVMQLILREKVLQRIPTVCGNLPIINSWEAVLDEGISKGKTNWQLYGSRKPGNESYELTHIFKIEVDKSDGEFMMIEEKVADFDITKADNLYKLSAQNDEHPAFEIHSNILEEYNKRCALENNNEKRKNVKKSGGNTKVRLLMDDDENIKLSDIHDKETLGRAVDKIMNNLNSGEYYIRETHLYTQLLPEKYYAPGSHLLNRQVAFALKDTDERLFLSWIMLRSKSHDFDYDTIPDLYNKWKNYFNTKNNGLTRKSIMYWAKQDAPEEFVKAKNSTMSYLVEESLNTLTDWDFAMILYELTKDKYICSDIKHAVWYMYNNHRWEIDKGDTLRMSISTDMFNLYQAKRDVALRELQKYTETDDLHKHFQAQISACCIACVKLKSSGSKNNIIREATPIFYDKYFNKNMDANKYLMCFSNGVIDFKNRIFRDGNPQDYITKSTNIPYYSIDITNADQTTTASEITEFMKQLFPVEELNTYMWDHLASCLIGENINQTFNIYRGNGSNGKSLLSDLMTHALGEYKGVVPITLVTRDRNNIGGTSSEVMQLKGVRYAVMQEPKKDEKINEGVMKELTGSDPIQARALYAETETFIPQFNLVVCTNNLFEINSNDDGTWRRIRICDFMSKFKGENDVVDHDPRYVFLKDKNLKDKIPNWAPLFASMLVKKAFETQGLVKDCPIVMASADKYRQGQDHISGFISEMVIMTGDQNDKVKKKELTQEFTSWFKESQGYRKMPKGVELYEYMDKKFGKCKSTGWHGVKILYPEVDELAQDAGNNDIESDD
jgi:P4 family phage/plasmid primase-like protien